MKFSLSETQLVAGRVLSHRSRRAAAWAIPLALVFGMASASHAAAVTVPTGLNPGDTYRIIFVTSATDGGLSSSISYYNTFVTTAANLDPGLAGLGTTWTALASTAAVNVLANTGLSAGDTTTPFYNTAGNLIATGVTVPTTGLYGGLTTAHVHSILSEVGGVPPGAVGVWTGTDSSSATAVALGASSSGLSGQYTALTAQWTANQPLSGASLHIYGISGVLTVPAAPVPEPSALALLGSVLLALGLARFRGVRR